MNYAHVLLSEKDKEFYKVERHWQAAFRAP
jgi:hypothetical protein